MNRRLALFIGAGLTCAFVLAFAGPGPAQDAEPIERFGFGRTPDAAEIEAWDIDVMPDGRQLPPGQGNVSQGAELYEYYCLACHGPEGRNGGSGDLVAPFDSANDFSGNDRPVRSIGSFWPYATTLYDYINRAMPLDTPGSLEPDEVYALVAYLLHLNGIVDADAVLDAGSLPEIEMPALPLFCWSDEVRAGLKSGAP